MLTEDEQLLGIVDSLYRHWQSMLPEPDDNQLTFSSDAAKVSPLIWCATRGLHSVIDYVDTLARYNLSQAIEGKAYRSFLPWQSTQRPGKQYLAKVMIGTPPQGKSYS
jgi:hypothetical protein